MARIRIEDLPDPAEALSDEQLAQVAGGLLSDPLKYDSKLLLSTTTTLSRLDIGFGKVAAAAWSVGCCNG